MKTYEYTNEKNNYKKQRGKRQRYKDNCIILGIKNSNNYTNKCPRCADGDKEKNKKVQRKNHEKSMF